jgi:hypothetical protein
MAKTPEHPIHPKLDDPMRPFYEGEYADLGVARESAHEQLVREATAAVGYPVYGKLLARDRVCKLAQDHPGGCEW